MQNLKKTQKTNNKPKLPRNNIENLPGMSKLLESLGHTERRRVDTNTNENWWVKKKNGLSKFTILCWATFIAILGHMWPVGHGVDIPEILYDHGFGDNFLDTTRKAQPMNKTTDTLDFIKIKNFCSVKPPGKRMRRQATDRGWGGNYF